LWLGLAGPAAALTPETARFRQVGVGEGLSQPSVKAIAQDRQGLLWFGTQTGLNRWDGERMRVFHHRSDVPGGLSDSSISALQLDGEGALWVATDGGGLCRYLDRIERFECFAHDPRDPASLPDDTVNTLLLDQHGELWVGTDAGLARWRGIGAGFQRVDLGHGVDDRVRALAAHPSQGIWIGTPSGLLRFNPAEGSAPAVAASLPPLPLGVRALLVDRAGMLWVGTGGEGLLRIDPASGAALRLVHGGQDGALGSNVVVALLQDREQRLWAGHENGVDLVIDAVAATPQVLNFSHRRNNAQGIGAGRIASLFEDAAGGLWFGSWIGGASLLRPSDRHVLSFTPDSPGMDAMLEPDVTALAVQEPSTFWLGTRAGLLAFDSETRGLRALASTRDRRVVSIEPYRDRLLLATDRGLHWLDPVEDRLSTVEMPDGMPAQITDMRRDGERLWVATREPALHVLDAGDFRLLARHPLDGSLRFSAPFDAEHMLVGTNAGLLWFARDGSRLIHHHLAEPGNPAALQSRKASSLLRARDGRLWLATGGGGLHRIDLSPGQSPAAARFTAFSRNGDPIADTISGVLEDGRGRLWLSSSRGIVRFDPDEGRFITYLSADGGLQTGYYVNVKAQLGSGLIAFGGLQGFTLIDPDRVAELSPPPRPLLTELQLDDRLIHPAPDAPGALLQQSIAMTEQLRLPAGQAKRLVLRFSAADFVNGSQLRFAFRLDGFDSHWVEHGSGRREAVYTNLPPGEYRFELVAISPGGERSEVFDALAISVLPHWWQTIWAQLLLVLGLLAAIVLAHRRRLGRIKAQRRALQQQVAERTAELSASNRALSDTLDTLRRTQRGLVEQEKMASLGALVAGVAHEINTPIGIAVTAASHLEDSARLLDDKLAAGSLSRQDLVELHGTLQEGARLVVGGLARASALIASFKQVAVDQSSEKRRPFELRACLADAQLTLEPGYRRGRHRLRIDCPEGIELDNYPGALFQIVAHLVGNSIAHGFDAGQQGQMRIDVTRQGEMIEMIYRDDGIGMPAEVAVHAFEPFVTTRRSSGATGLGLHVVYNLVTRVLGGSIDLQTAPGAGCVFVLRFPLHAPQRGEPAAAETAGR
jgi:ligand-binding sensor domain-containing protein/signal transduction histidine kinase